MNSFGNPPKSYGKSFSISSCARCLATTETFNSKYQALKTSKKKISRTSKCNTANP
jgi:hypothetical protein